MMITYPIEQTLISIILTSNVVYAEYNLFGHAGQAYAIQVSIGQPPQHLNVLIDTGSTTLAIASSADSASNKYFIAKNSSSLYDSGKKVQAKYSQGMWEGTFATDLVQFSSLPSVPGVRSDIALITKSHQFFMNGANWQGLLGLAYLPVGAWAENVVLESWIDSVNTFLKKPMSFQLDLCGVLSATNSTHYGKFKIIGDAFIDVNYDAFKTPVLRTRWYEVGVLSIRTMDSESYVIFTHSKNESIYEKQIEECQKLNEEKSIVDSGTTNIKLPDKYFKEIVDKLRDAAKNSNVFILDEFWYQGEASVII